MQQVLANPSLATVMPQLCFPHQPLGRAKIVAAVVGNVPPDPVSDPCPSLPHVTGEPTDVLSRVVQRRNCGTQRLTLHRQLTRRAQRCCDKRLSHALDTNP